MKSMLFNHCLRRTASTLFTLGLLGVAFSARAGGLTNNFTYSFDYLTNGIVGETNWDGVYLGFGDVPNGDPGGSGGGFSSFASSVAGTPGYLGVRATGGDWSGAGDDGFFIYKVVFGDFDASVESVPSDLNLNAQFDNGAFNFAGLLARLYNTNNSGAPFSPNAAASENWMAIFRFQEFGVNGESEVRIATNGVNDELTYPDDISTTNLTHFYRIQRLGDTFNLYWKTNSSDPWFLQQTLSRPEWHGLAVQIGIAQADFNTVSHDAIFTDFELNGTNITFPAMPPAPSALQQAGSNPNGSLTLSWTKGSPSDNSLVIMRQSKPVQQNPVNGLTYGADATFGDTNAQVGGNEYVVYNGNGNSVTVTNLGGNNLTYHVVVYEYSTASGKPVYNTAVPATNNFAGPGIITGVTLSVGSTDIPLGGATAARLFATFSTGATVEETTSATWGSGDTTIIQVGTDGAVNGIANGATSITGTLGAFNASTNVSIHTPVFTDNFGVNHDYITNGLQGSTWDGAYLNFGDVPGGSVGNDGVAGQTFALNANITATNVLYLQAAGGSWRVAGDDGTFLFKILTGDFEASVHVITGTINANFAGLMARLYNNSGTASQGGGGGAGGTETHVNWGNPQQGIPSARLTIDSGGTTTVGGLTTDRWLLMERVNSTNFYFFERATTNDLWQAVPAATMVIPEAANNAPMQLGLFQEMRASTTDNAQFDTLMIDGPGIVSPAGTQPPPPASNLAVTLNPDLSMTFNWVAASNGVPVQSILVMRGGAPVSAQPTYGMGFTVGPGTYPFGTGMSLGAGNWVVFRSANPPASTNNTATITGLAPGVTYYAAVYTFVGAFPTRVFNSVLPATGATVPQLDGVLQTVFVNPVPQIPLGGIQPAQVFGVYGGVPVNVSLFATVTIANTNVAQFADGTFSGMGLGSTTAQIVFGGFTNTINLKVRTAAFTDEFNVNHDYLASGVAGTPWDGVYRQGTSGDTNEVPDSEYVPPVGAGTVTADANISSNGVLTLISSGPGWEENNAGGFFLYKFVPGDFQTAIHIRSYDVAGFNQPGLLARAFSYGTNGTTLGAPYVIGTLRTNASDQSGEVVVNVFGESWVSLTRFDEFGIGTYVRLNIDSAVHQHTQPDEGDTNFWMLIMRSQGTNFLFYQRLDNTGPWRLVPNKTQIHEPSFAGATMQVGPMAGAWSGPGANNGVAFEHFMLDAVPKLQAHTSGNNIVLSWPTVPGVVLKQGGTLTSTATWTTVPGTITTTNGLSTLSVPITGAASFYALFH